MEKVLYIGIHLLRLHLCHEKNFLIAYHSLLNSGNRFSPDNIKIYCHLRKHCESSQRYRRKYHLLIFHPLSPVLYIRQQTCFAGLLPPSTIKGSVK